MKIAFVYPGQGSQVVKMGQDLYEHLPIVKATYDQAMTISGVDIAKLSFEGSEEELKDTFNAQIAILTMSTAITNQLLSENVTASYSLGLSLGEYSALVQSGKIIFADALPLVMKRAQFMIDASANIDGSMRVCLGATKEAINEIIASNRLEDKISIANINGYEQIVIVGLESDLVTYEKLFIDRGVKRYMKIPVGGPFHSKYLQPAYLQLREYLTREVNLHPFNNPVISNYTALPFSEEKDQFIETLAKQVMSSVELVKSIEYLIEQDVEVFVELGPQKIVSGLIKKISKDVQIFNIDSYDKYKQFMKFYEENNGK